MARYTFADALPLNGSSAPLLTAAIALPYPVSLATLARRAAISRFAAARAVTDLVHREVLLVKEDEYSFNDSHDLADLLRTLAWRFGGVLRPDPGAEQYWRAQSPRWNDVYYQDLIPESLLKLPSKVKDPVNATGPNLIDARDIHSWAWAMVPELRDYEHEGQEVYRLWANERLRDVIHQTLHFGGALNEAMRTLAQECDEEAQGNTDPRSTCVSIETWARATYLVSAEVRDVLRVIEILDIACRVGNRVNSLRDNALEALRDVDHAGQESQFREAWIEQASQAAAEATLLWADDSHGVYKRIGGQPRPADVGTAGDQVLAIRLLRTATRLASKVDEMAAHPGFLQWTLDEPEAAAQVDLVRSIPETSLRGYREHQEAASQPKVRILGVASANPDNAT